MKPSTETVRLLRPSEVAERFGVDPRTVTRWARVGLVPSVVSPGGHHRFDPAVIDRLLNPPAEVDQ